MRRLVTLVSVASMLVLAAGPAPGALGGTDAARRPDAARPRTIVAAPPIVHGRAVDHAFPAATSLERFSSGARPAAPARFATAASAPQPRTPSTLFGFEAQTDLDGSLPSDTTGALGDAYFVTAVNIRVAVYDLAGVEVLAPTLLSTLHPNAAGRFVFDPKVIYDPYHDTFLLVYLVQQDVPRYSKILTVAIPDATANDPSTWCAVSFAGDSVPGKPKVWADYPTVGFTPDRVTIATNQFSFPSSRGEFAYAQVMSIPSADLYGCTAPPAADVFAGAFTIDPDGAPGFTLQPAQTVDATSGPQLLVSSEVRGKGSYLALWRIKTTKRGLRIVKGIVPIGRVFPPPPGTQGGAPVEDPDTYWDTGDQRLTTAFFDADDNRLFTAHAATADLKPDAGGQYIESVVRWYEVSPASKLTRSVLERRGTIGAAGVDVGWPSVATDAGGNLFVTYSRASAVTDEFLSAWVAEVPPGSNVATQLLLAPGLATYEVALGPERWGDYTAMNRDPADPTRIATFNQIALDASTWQQVVHVVTQV
ncbi:MAG: hypothetical protein ACXWX6_00815 [Actinomycetota bacterium]